MLICNVKITGQTIFNSKSVQTPHSVFSLSAMLKFPNLLSYGNSDGSRLKANSFLLSVCSPVLHKMICGSFNESGGRVMEIKDVDGAAFRKVLCAWCAGCGKELEPRADVGVLLKLGSVADRFQVTAVVTALEEVIFGQLSVAACTDVLSWCGGRGLSVLTSW